MAEEGEDGEFADCSYWDNRYSKSTASEPSYDWLRSYQSLVPFFEKHLFVPKPPATRPHILHLGSGNSTVPIDLHRAGYTIQACIDFSTVVVDTMKQMHEEGGDIKWVTGDVRDMKQQVPDASVDVAFDKSTLDSMVWGSAWDPPETVIQDTTHYINEVARVLKPNGIFLCITFKQPHFQKRFLAREGIWDLAIESLGDEGGVLEYFGFVIKKPLLEESDTTSYILKARS